MIISVFAETMQLKHGFRIHDRINDIWYTFSCRNPEDEERWLRAFHEERQRVDLDRENGFDLRKFKEKAFSSQLKRQMYPSQAKGDSQSVCLSLAGCLHFFLSLSVSVYVCLSVYLSVSLLSPCLPLCVCLCLS